MSKLLGIKQLCEFWQTIKSTFVRKAGDTMTGTLNMKDNGIDTSSTPGTDQWGSTGYYIVDKNGTQIGYIDGANLSSGSQGMEVVSIKRMNGTPYRNGFYLGIKTDGSPYITFSNDAARVAWLNALCVGTISMAGTTTGTQSVPNGTVKAVRTLTLGVGTWVIVGQIDYASGGTSGTYRAAWLGNSSSQRQYAASEVASPTTGNCTAQAVTIQKFTSSTTIYLNAFQGSGGALNVNNSATYIVAIRIG